MNYSELDCMVYYVFLVLYCIYKFVLQRSHNYGVVYCNIEHNSVRKQAELLPVFDVPLSLCLSVPHI